MSDPTPNPAHDDNGVPLCNQAGCGLFDGKRCKAVGFRPDRFCEPALVELVVENKALKARVVELGARQNPQPVGHDARSGIQAAAHDLVLADGFLGICRAAMAIRGIRQADVARRLGLSVGKLSELLNGRRPMTPRVVADICAVLGIDECLVPQSTSCPEGSPAAPAAPTGGTKPDALWRVVYRDQYGRRCTAFVATDSADIIRALARTAISILKTDPVTGWAIGDEHTAVTIEAAPPEDLLDRITPEPACRHTRRSLRPDAHGNPVTTCIDCGEDCSP